MMQFRSGRESFCPPLRSGAHRALCQSHPRAVLLYCSGDSHPPIHARSRSAAMESGHPCEPRVDVHEHGWRMAPDLRSGGPSSSRTGSNPSPCWSPSQSGLASPLITGLQHPSPSRVLVFPSHIRRLYPHEIPGTTSQCRGPIVSS